MIVDWDPAIGAGEALVAGGTIALAWFTWRLARQTRADVALTAQSIEAADMPFVIAEPVPDQAGGFSRGMVFGQVTGGGWLELAITNVGKGPAIVDSISLELCVPGDRAILKPLQRHVPLAAAATQALSLETVRQPDWNPPADAPAIEGELQITYSHASGTTYVTRSSVLVDGKWVNCVTFARAPAATASAA